MATDSDTLDLVGNRLEFGKRDRKSLIDRACIALAKTPSNPLPDPESLESQPGTLYEEANEMGYVWRSVQRAASAMGVMRAKQGPITVWLLPSLGD